MEVKQNFDNINCRSLCAVGSGIVRLDEAWEGLSFIGSAISKFSSLQGDGISQVLAVDVKCQFNIHNIP